MKLILQIGSYWPAPVKRTWMFLFLSVFFAGNMYAQSFFIDSLKNVLTQTRLKPETRALTMSHLARDLYETDMPAAIHYATEAIRLSSAFSDGQYKAFGLATMAYLDILRDSLARAQHHMDSALFFADKTNNKIIKGYVWLRKGRLEYIVNNTDKAMRSLLKALQLLEGQKAYDYESLVYHYLASLYADLNDLQKMGKYTQLSLAAAHQSDNLDMICNAYLAMGSFFLHKFRQDTTQKKLLDSSVSYNRKLLALAGSRPERIINHSTIGAAALNTANIYWEFYPKTYKDSALKYINSALDIARPIGSGEIIANCYGILSEYALAENDYPTAEKLFLKGLAEIEYSPGSIPQIKASMLKGLATVAEKSGNNAGALHYYKEYQRYTQEAYNIEKLATAQKLEVQYESEKKDRELEVLKERAAFNRRLNFIYVSLAAAGLVALIFLFRSYHFRLKSSIQQQRLRAEEAARLKAEQELLQERQERLQKELLAGTLQVEEKNELLQTLRDKLSAHAEATPLKNQVERIIKENNRMDEDFELAKSSFAEIHPGFFTRLQEKADNTLTRLDLKYCSYILMGLSNKEIANRLGVDPKSIRMARYRIKQKLQLNKEENLDGAIRSLA